MKRNFALRRLSCLLMVLTAILGVVSGPKAGGVILDGQTTLVMVDEPGCVYCAKWEREVMSGYHASAEGKFAPLQRLRLGSPSLAEIGQLAYTPTFVLIVRGQEAGRIVGYAGADFFWAELDRLYGKAGFKLDGEPQQILERRVDSGGAYRPN